MKNNANDLLQKFLAIGGRADCAVKYIDKGFYQKAKAYLQEIIKISNKEIEKVKKENKK